MESKRPESPLYQLLNEINRASPNVPLMAVAMTVALPDICFSLVSEDGRSDGERYRAWCAENLKDSYFNYVTPEDLWSMRCGVLHNGRFGDLKHSVARVIFLLPTPRMTLMDARMGDAYAYGVVEFCKNFCDAVFRWSESHRRDERMVANLPHLMQYRPEGLDPYIVGAAVLA